MSKAEVDYVDLDFSKFSLEELMEQTIKITAPGYSCLRGPRPSGAMIVANSAVDGGRAYFPIYGYVQPSKGTKSCKEIGECMIRDGHCVRCLHAEVNAIMAATRTRNIRLTGASIFSINKPCYNCSLHIIAANIKKIYYAYAVYDEERTREALEVAGVECIHVPVD